MTELLGIPRKVAALQLGISRQALGKAIFRTQGDEAYETLLALGMAG